MSSIQLKNRLPLGTSAPQAVAGEVGGLRRYEKLLLGAAIFELPLQIDTYLMYREFDGNLGAVGGVNLSVGLMAVLALYFFWLVQQVDVFSKPTHKKVRGLPMLFYIGTVVVSIAAAQVKSLAVFDLIILLQAYLLFLYLANRIRTMSDLKFVLIVFCSTVIFQSLLIFFTMSMDYTGERVKLGPISVEVGEEGRPGGSLHSPTLAGSYLAFLWLPALGMLMTPTKGMFRTVATATIILGGLAILMTQTRGAIFTTALGSVTVAGFCLARGWFPIRLLVIGVLLAAIGIVPLLGVIEKRVQGDDRGSAEARIHLSEIAFEIIKDYPLFGVGAGNCHLAGLRHANEAKYRSLWYFTVHCKYLLVWVETGIVGLLAFLILLGSGIRDAFATWKSGNRILAPIGIGIMVAILGNMLHMFVDIFNSRPQVHSLWAMLGLVAAIRVIATENAKAGLDDENKLSDQSDDSEKQLLEVIHG
jgi:O-antigen ligase